MNRLSQILAEEGLTRSATSAPRLQAILIAEALDRQAPGRAYGNAMRTIEGKYKDAHVQINVYSSFITVHLAFGKIYHMWENRTHWSENGIVEASGGHAGHTDQWRIGGVKGGGRVSAGFDVRLELTPEQVIPILHTFKNRVHGEALDERDFGSALHNAEESEEGW